MNIALLVTLALFYSPPQTQFHSVAPLQTNIPIDGTPDQDDDDDVGSYEDDNGGDDDNEGHGGDNFVSLQTNISFNDTRDQYQHHQQHHKSIIFISGIFLHNICHQHQDKYAEQHIYITRFTFFPPFIIATLSSRSSSHHPQIIILMIIIISFTKLSSFHRVKILRFTLAAWFPVKS